jgi:hypothetical protein
MVTHKSTLSFVLINRVSCTYKDGNDALRQENEPKIYTRNVKGNNYAHDVDLSFDFVIISSC